ncbi:MAG: hypothetical protein K2H20_02260 [Bacilli bacterium]|nr:hypothetical protein [Bacilli bacterium]
MSKIKLTESELKQIITQSINEALEDEGLWNQVKQGAKSFFGNGYGKDNPNNFRNTTSNRQDRGEHTANVLNGSTPMNLKGRWNAAKTGFQQQGTVDKVDDTLKFLNNLISNGKITPETTVGELVRQGGKFGKNLDSVKRGANAKISKANNDIYKGQNTGVMGSGKTATV